MAMQWRERVRAVRGSLVALARTDLARQMGELMTNELPALLVDALGAAPAQPAAVSAALDRELARVVRMCHAERRLLGSRQAREVLAVRLSLARMASATTLLGGTVRRCAAGLWQADPRLLSLASVPTEAQATPAINPLTCEECRQVAEQLRRTLGEVARAAGHIQRALRGPRAADPAVAVAALAQTGALVGWLRQAQGGRTPLH
ncbi:MAG TPA: hypothetical protein VGR57_18725 [Ktedonobacterales bacterium]|nr:hypothetical protein [Ktedonobacterales bacterium]